MSDRDKTQHDPVRTRLGVVETPRGAEQDLSESVVLDRYLVQAKLGEGAMGVVYRGSDIQTHRGVAIKVMHRHLGNEPTMVARFRREAKAAARLRHENVVGVLDAGAHQGSPVMVQELAIGPTLRDVMDEPIELPRAKQLIAAILRGLDHAHAAKLVHRDLKPENVIVEQRDDGTEVPRIVDFGIAALVDPEDTIGGPKLTGTGVVIGTPMYMAPEQAMGEPIDHRIDLFALGVVMYEMLAGQPPFDGTVHQIVLANIKKDPPPIANADPLVEHFARKLMARDLTKRFASAHAALELLELIDLDPSSAGLELGRTDANKAAALIGLPEPPKLPED